MEAALAEPKALCPDPPLVGRIFAFAAAPAAMRFLQSSTSIGKIVLTLEGVDRASR